MYYILLHLFIISCLLFIYFCGGIWSSGLISCSISFQALSGYYHQQHHLLVVQKNEEHLWCMWHYPEPAIPARWRSAIGEVQPDCNASILNSVLKQSLLYTSPTFLLCWDLIKVKANIHMDISCVDEHMGLRQWAVTLHRWRHMRLLLTQILNVLNKVKKVDYKTKKCG